jgi:YbbR domain-containing protein
MPEWTRTLGKWLQEYVVTDWKYKLVSLAAALIIWTYVAGQQSMQIILSVPLQFQNIPYGSHMVDPKVSAAEVTLSGRRERILNLSKQQIIVSLDLAGLRNGRNLYLISSRDVIVPPGIDVKDVSPRQLSIQLASEIPTPK